jgi:hypothetical protein
MSTVAEVYATDLSHHGQTLGVVWRFFLVRPPGPDPAQRRIRIRRSVPGPQAVLFSVVAQIPLELRLWLRDEFDLQGEAVTTALTASNVFPQPPGVVGSNWGPDWHPKVDHFGPRTSWTHSVLVTLRATALPIMQEIWHTIANTARRHRVVVMIQDVDKDTTPDAYTSHRARLLATFAPGTLAFGHAAGWNNSGTANSRSGLSHSWSTSGTWILPLRLGRPGVLPRHDTICNQHNVRLLLFDPVGSIPDVQPSRLQDFLYCTVTTGGQGPADSPQHPMSWWPKDGSTCNLLWAKVAGAGSQPFLLPWSILCWSPDPHVNDIDLPAGAVAPDLWDTAVHLKSVLTSLRSRTLDSSIVLDGVIPQAAIDLFKLLGVPGSQQKSLLTRLIQDPLRDVRRLFTLFPKSPRQLCYKLSPSCL